MGCSQHVSFCNGNDENPDKPDALDISKPVNRNVVYIIEKHWEEKILNV